MSIAFGKWLVKRTNGVSAIAYMILDTSNHFSFLIDCVDCLSNDKFCCRPIFLCMNKRKCLTKSLKMFLY